MSLYLFASNAILARTTFSSIYLDIKAIIQKILVLKKIGRFEDLSSIIDNLPGIIG